MKYEIIIAIVNFGMGSKLFKSARKHGITGGTITIARGTASSGVLNFLGLADIRKELVYMLADGDVAAHVIEKLNAEYRFDKPNHGIVFTMGVENAVGCSGLTKEVTKWEENEVNFKLITTIVDKGRAEDVVEFARLGGAKGGTVIGARGSGAHEHCKVFYIDIEPEKEVVMILAEEELVESIINSINSNMHIEESGKGIIFLQDVSKAYGVYR